MSTESAREERLLVLRREGRSFATIARELGLDSAVVAFDAYQGAIQSRPPQQRAVLQRDEVERLDRLAGLLREQSSAGDPDAERKLGVIERLRATVLAEWSSGPTSAG